MHLKISAFFVRRQWPSWPFLKSTDSGSHFPRARKVFAGGAYVFDRLHMSHRRRRSTRFAVPCSSRRASDGWGDVPLVLALRSSIDLWDGNVSSRAHCRMNLSVEAI